MRIRAAAAWIGLVSCGFLAGGCGSDDPIRPRHVLAKTVHVELDVDLSSQDGSPGSPVRVRAIARNRGTATVYGAAVSAPCDCEGLSIEILGPNGQKVWMLDPCQPLPICLCAPSALTPGATLPRATLFEGSVHRIVSQAPRECVEEQAMSGEYTAVAHYEYFVPGDYTTRTLEKRAAFHWTGP